jgi:AcrR family transcriptional regulator
MSELSRSPEVQLGGKRARNRDATRERIFDAALDEFKRAGFEGASISAIAKKAGVSRPTFYAHFPTKEDVLLELQWRFDLHLVERMRGCATLRETLFRLAEAHAELEDIVGDRELLRAVQAVYAKRPFLQPEDAQPFPLVAVMRLYFEDAEARGELREGLDPREASRIYLAGIFGCLITGPGSVRRHRHELETLATLFLRDADGPGGRSAKGGKRSKATRRRKAAATGRRRSD